MAKEIYIVTDGSYSDYHISAVFSNNEDAERYQKLTQDDEIEVWEIDSIDFSKRLDLLYWTITFFRNGDIHSVAQSCPSEETLSKESYDGVMYIGGSLRYIDYDILIRLWAKSKEAAIKIATEFRTILLGSHPEIVEAIRQSEGGEWVKLTRDMIETKEAICIPTKKKNRS